jgi:DNA-binding GntR family transcriptional regulator
VAPTRRSPTGDAVYNDIRRRILGGQLPAGHILNASHLSKKMAASRTPIREALLRLLAEGLLVESPRGLAIRQLSEEEIMEVYEVRIPLEALAARLAATHVTALHLAQIEAAHEKFAWAARQPEPDVDWLAGANIDFHRAICQAARNRLLLEFISKIYETVGRFRTTTLGRPGRLSTALAEHEELVAAIAARDAPGAEEIARRHMQGALHVRLEMYREARGRPASS